MKADITTTNILSNDECRICVLYAGCHYAERRHAECHYAECRGTMWCTIQSSNQERETIDLKYTGWAYTRGQYYKPICNCYFYNILISLSVTFSHFQSLSVTFSHFQSISVTFSHFQSLSVTFSHFQSLSVTSTLAYLKVTLEAYHILELRVTASRTPL